MSTIPFPSLAPAVRFLAGGAIALCACDGSEHVQIDQPEAWYQAGASHHGKHGLGGIAIGFAGYEAAGLVTDQSDRRVACGVALGVVVGVGYELVEGRDGQSYVDPVDAAWVAAGALVGATIADLTHDAVSLALTHRSAAIVVAWRF